MKYSMESFGVVLELVGEELVVEGQAEGGFVIGRTAFVGLLHVVRTLEVLVLVGLVILVLVLMVELPHVGLLGPVVLDQYLDHLQLSIDPVGLGPFDQGGHLRRRGWGRTIVFRRNVSSAIGLLLHDGGAGRPTARSAGR